MQHKDGGTKTDSKGSLIWDIRELIDGVQNHGLKGKEYWFKYLTANGTEIFQEICWKLQAFEQYELALAKLESLSENLKRIDVMSEEVRGIDMSIRELRKGLEVSLQLQNSQLLEDLKKVLDSRDISSIESEKRSAMENALDYIYEHASTNELDDIQEAIDTMKKAKLVDNVRGG